MVRLAAREPALARPLGQLTDGFAGVGAVVRDLLDAGLGPDHLEPALERVAEEEVNFGRSAIERAAALLRVAVDAREALLGLGLTPDADLFARATALVSSDPDVVLPGTQLFVHAIADATGVASDLLAAATRAFETVIVAEEPAGFEGERLAFGRRLSDRLAGIAAMERLAPNPAAPRIRLLRVPDPEGEAALAIARLGERAQASGRPEDLAVIARQLTPYTESLAREIDRRAVPASGESGPAGPAARVAATWIELLTLGGEADLGILLAAAGEALAAQSGARVWELRHGAAALDAHDLAGFAGLSTRSARAGSSADPRLPIRDRMTALAEEGRLLAIERRLPGSKILAAATAGRRLLAGLQTLAGRGTLAVALSTLGRLLNEFVADPVVRRELFDALAPLQGAPPPTMASEFAGVEVVQLLRDAWSQLATAPFGAESKEAGDGGLSLLSVTDARGLTFDSLAIVGLAHDQFPRSIRSDPFLPDPLRQRLRDLLPDLPVKAEGHDEERFLFAQLLGAADEIDLYSPRRDSEGKELAESSFLAPLARAGRIAEILDLHPSRDLTPVAALEIAERLALAAGSQTLEASVCAAIVEARERFGGDTGDAPAVANARLAALREFDVAPGPTPAAGSDRSSDSSERASLRLSRRGWTATAGARANCAIRAPPLRRSRRSRRSAPVAGRLSSSACCAWLRHLQPASSCRPFHRLSSGSRRIRRCNGWRRPSSPRALRSRRRWPAGKSPSPGRLTRSSTKSSHARRARHLRMRVSSPSSLPWRLSSPCARG